MKNTTLRKKIKNGEFTIGSWITIGHPSIVEALAYNKFDWLTIDIEHTTIDFQMVQTLITTIQACNISALVRVSKNEDVYIKKVLDAGADGVIVPMVNTEIEAKRAIDSVKYPPEGKRGVGLYRAQCYGLNDGFNSYKKWLKEYVIVILQIEHITAVDNIQKILQVPGIDGILIGPYDLSSSLGFPGDYDNPLVINAINKIKDECLKYKIPLGFHVISPNVELVKEKIKEGYSIIAFSTDILFLGNKAEDEMKKFELTH